MILYVSSDKARSRCKVWMLNVVIIGKEPIMVAVIAIGTADDTHIILDDDVVPVR